ncbi:MAG: nicotinate-nucleotide--dimethylbenzimidazole phosphoribosyltransferase [Clostridia bacterium]|nr:nicotinate-nucleotide--dimethylbenzimidazole phosphoribosyltransferase [Clostridia bacterium]
MELLSKTIREINGLDEESMRLARQRSDNLIKPPGSLGALEEAVVKLAGIYREPIPSPGEKVVMVMAGDHGVVAEGVSAFPQEVTPQMVMGFLNGQAGINVLSRHAGAKVVITDVGMASPPIEHPGLNNCRVKNGTDNMAQGPAMSREEAAQAIEVGIRLVQEQIDQGARMVATGDMGIGNTTPSTAILAAISGIPVEEITGRGTGLDDRGLKLKQEVIKKALALNKPDPQDGLDVLAKVGGLEIGALAGVVLGAAARRIPVVIDGLISGAAALIAKTIAPQSVDYMLPSHLSQEPGHKLVLQQLGLKPLLHLDMRLGEGTGAAIAFMVFDAAMKCHAQMPTFAEAGVTNKE